eukprot:SAG22_NODE_5987_length_920_cov_2.576127_1_plen_57_part_10
MLFFSVRLFRVAHCLRELIIRILLPSNYKMCYDVVPSALLDDEDEFEPKGEADTSTE